MKYLVIIQARCGSSRLPNKVLADLGGQPVLQRMIERVKKSQTISPDEILVATSIEKNNLPIILLCGQIGTRVFVGSETDVLDRFYQAARLFHPQYVIRLTADCPLFDVRLLDDAIQRLQPETDLLAMCSETFPDGLDFEIMKWQALQKVWADAKMQSEREHVTLYMLNHPELFTVQDYVCPIPNIGHYRWTVDEPEDYEVVQCVYQHFLEQKNIDFSYQDILELFGQYPELYDKNKKFSRNEGLKRSLKNDVVFDR